METCKRLTIKLTESQSVDKEKKTAMKNYKSFIVHGSSGDIMAIQTHFRYIFMIIQFFYFITNSLKYYAEYNKSLILECTVYEVTANIKIT